MMHQPITLRVSFVQLAGALLLLMSALTSKTFAESAPEPALTSFPLWEKALAPLKHEQLADLANAYDFAHFLMVPMHRAFETGDTAGQRLFAELISEMDENSYAKLNLLTRMQLDYFISEFLLLKAQIGPLDSAGKALLTRQWQKFENYWVLDPFKQWAPAPYAGVRGRLISILFPTGKISGKRYLQAATDFELFGLAVAANLKVISQLEGDPLPEEAANLAGESGRLTAQLVRSRGEFLDAGWLFQRGYWRDHRDFLHAGHDVLAPDLVPAPIEDVAQDSSHSMRWPLWIRSFHRAADNDADKHLYVQIAGALSEQYRYKVIKVTNDGLVMNNFMDGRNGVYRYKYATVGANQLNGYGPNALSGSLFIGWLCFLPEMEATMKAMSESFPLTPAMIETYTGPNTVRLRHPLFAQPGIYTNGTAEFIAKLAVDCAKLAEKYWNDP